MLTIFFVWIACAVIVGVVASARGRVGFGWFLLSLVISPLIVGLVVLALPRQDAAGATGWTSPSPSSIFKWFGITIVFGMLVVVGMFVLALFLIVQHGGA